MSTKTLRLGDYGSVFVVTILDDGSPVDLTTATSMTIKFKKPDRDLVTKTATLYTTGPDGKIKYTIQSGLIDQVGTWYFQANIRFSGSAWTTTVGSFEVDDLLVTA